MRSDILSLLERNAKLTAEDIAVRLGVSEKFIKSL